MSKQDRQGVRTAADIERKYNFGKSFAEVMGIAKDAQETAEEAVSSSDKLDKSLTAEEIYNRLTNNGTLQGLYRDDDGELYVNAEYLYALEKLFAKDISMSGTFTYTTETFLEPGEEEVLTLEKHIYGGEYMSPDQIPLYDFNNDGLLDYRDLATAQMCARGNRSLADWSGAVKTPVTMTIDLKNTKKFIKITGTNMWGRDVEQYIGTDLTNIRFNGMKDYIVSEGNEMNSDNDVALRWYYRKWASGKVECWGSSVSTTFEINKAHGGGYIADGMFWKFPDGLFGTTPTATISFNSENYGMPLVSMRDLSAVGIGVLLFEPNLSSRSGTFHIYAIGSMY